MEEVTCKVVLDTVEPNNEHFQGYLDGANIAWSAVGNYGNYIQVEYTGTRRALEAMIKKHFSTNDPAHDSSMVDGIVPVGSAMEKADRDRLIELLVESAADMYGDEKSYEVVEEIVGMVRDGIRGYVDEPDEALLAEASSDYVDEEGKLVGDPVGGDWDPTEDEKFRIFAKYRFPDVLCKVCAGTGEVHGQFGESLIDCPECHSSGLSGLVLPPKYTVIRNRQVTEYVELRAATPQEAAEKSKKSDAWTGQSDEQLTLEVFLAEDAAAPDGSGEGSSDPLYQE